MTKVLLRSAGKTAYSRPWTARCFSIELPVARIAEARADALAFSVLKRARAQYGIPRAEFTKTGKLSRGILPDVQRFFGYLLYDQTRDICAAACSVRIKKQPILSDGLFFAACGYPGKGSPQRSRTSTA